MNQASLTGYIMLHCAHYWVIAAPDGPTSEGVCRRCGHHREFVNSVDIGSPWSKPEQHSWSENRGRKNVGSSAGVRKSHESNTESTR